MVPGTNGNGIGLVQTDRSHDPATYGPQIVQHVYVHDNIIDLSPETYGDNLNGNGAISDDNGIDILESR